MNIKKNYAFIDGSYNPKTKVYGCGGFLIDQYGKKHIIQAKGFDPRMAHMRNVAGEILGARMAIRKALDLRMEKLYLFHDYEGVAKWPNGAWKCTRSATKKYSEFVQRARNEGLSIHFRHVKGHSGSAGNEEADRLAKIAVKLL